METILLNNGKTLPLEGFGVFQIADQTLCQQAVLEALQEGYRLIDTAASYFNEEAVGRALRTSGLPRDEVFVTTKVWVQDFGEVKTREAVLRSLEKLGLEYIDMVLLHQQMGDYYGAWRALEALVQEGIIGTIGVSNFYPDRLIGLCQFTEVTPAVNQVETHVFHQQQAAHQYMKKYGVQHESWGPFAEGRNDFFTNPVLNEIGQKYNKSAAQTALRFLLQSDVVVIPKSTHKERMEQNLDVFDFTLTEQEMQAIRQLDEGKSLFFSHYDPTTVEMITNMGKTRKV